MKIIINSEEHELDLSAPEYSSFGLSHDDFNLNEHSDENTLESAQRLCASLSTKLDALYIENKKRRFLIKEISGYVK